MMRPSQADRVEFTVDGEAMAIENGTVVEQLNRSEIDISIATAKRYPRSLQAFRDRLISRATSSREIAASCYYLVPREGRQIEGPSVRLAEIAAASYGNLRSNVYIVDDDGDFVVARGMCHDLETNVSVTREVRRRIVNRRGERYSTDMIQVTGNAAAAIAYRNAVFCVVPLALIPGLHEAIMKVAVGEGKELEARKVEMVKWFTSKGVSEERLLESVNRESVDDMTLRDVSFLLQVATAIQDGDTSIAEAFPVQKRESASVDIDDVKPGDNGNRGHGQDGLDKIAKGGKRGKSKAEETEAACAGCGALGAPLNKAGVCPNCEEKHDE